MKAEKKRLAKLEAAKTDQYGRPLKKPTKKKAGAGSSAAKKKTITTTPAEPSKTAGKTSPTAAKAPEGKNADLPKTEEEKEAEETTLE